MFKNGVTIERFKGKRAYLSALSAGEVKIIIKTNLNKAKSERA